jgi:Transcriptional Coactivator p15 (PC4)
MLIGKIDLKSKQKILVTIRAVKGVQMIDVRVHTTSEDGEYVATPAGISLLPDQTDQTIELLKEARRRIAEQGNGG